MDLNKPYFIRNKVEQNCLFKSISWTPRNKIIGQQMNIDTFFTIFSLYTFAQFAIKARIRVPYPIPE